jgi:hypothetical protein
MSRRINPATIIPEYKFSVGFRAPAKDYASADLVVANLGAKLGIPQEHNFGAMELPPGDNQSPRLHRYLGRVAFIDWDAGADVWTAEIKIDVLNPGVVSRALAKLTHREPKAEIGAGAAGRQPFGGGTDAVPPGVPPLPLGPQGDLLHV